MNRCLPVTLAALLAFALQARALASDFEIPDWKSDESGTTAALGSACGISVESRLIGSARQNELHLFIHNGSDKKVFLDPQNIVLKFEGGPERKPAYPAPPQSLSIPPQERILLAVPFPAKEDFKGRSRIDATLPFSKKDTGGPCEVRLVIKRPPTQRDRPETYTTYTTAVINIDVGAVIGRFGNFSKVGKNTGPMVAVQGQLFVFPGHAVFGAITYEGFGGGDGPRLQPELGTSTPNLFGTNFSAGYAFRHVTRKNIVLGYEIGPGAYVFNYKKPGTESQIGGKSAFSASQKVSVGYNPGFLRDYFNGATVGFGLAAYHIWIPRGGIGSISTTGHSVGAGLRVMIGF